MIRIDPALHDELVQKWLFTNDYERERISRACCG